MEKQLLKNTFSFIILMFSVSMLHAQLVKCKGPKVIECYTTRAGDYVCHCVHPPKLSISGTQLNHPISTGKCRERTMQICDITGRLIKALANTGMEAGMHQLIWNAKDEKGNLVSTGIYFLSVQTGNYSETKKVTAVR